jgi:lon-related putative ATP-dependent protease
VSGGIPLEPARLRRRCDPASLRFESTAAVEPLDATIGQARAMDAIAFGLDIRDPGYNLFVLGPTGTGKRTTLRAYLERAARDRPAPGDWVYLFDFDDERRPIALELPSGSGPGLARDMAQFVDEARREITRTFESDEYQHRARRIASEVEARREKVLAGFRAAAGKLGLALEFSAAGIMTLPVRDGRPVAPEEFEHLSDAEREAYRAAGHVIEEQVPEVMGQLRALEREARERIAQQDREVTLFAIGHLVDGLKARYSSVPRLQAWLDRVREDVLEHVPLFRTPPAGEPQENAPDAAAAGAAAERRRSRDQSIARYEANVLVSHAGETGAPVVIEPSPTFYNLFGRIEYETMFGAVTTDHRHIRSGAIHRANGGYLLLQAADLVGDQPAWERLKETLRTGRARMENVGAQVTLFPTSTLDPEPIAIDLKVVLVGPTGLYQALHLMDEEFRKLFKVRAEFALEMPWGDAEAALYAAFISSRARNEGLRHFSRGAVGRVVEQGARIAEHQGKLSTRFAEIVDLVTEASYWAGESGRDLVEAGDVDRAIERHAARASLFEEHMRELIAEGGLHIETDGESVGQINGLAVLNAGDNGFGQPIRITATTAVGRGELVHVDRETELSGRIHTKGFLIIGGFLQDRYGRDRQLALRASVVVEQSYGEIEGDSASVAELCALLSSLADAPISQSIAVTGSVDQHGNVQPIGGVNEKIEGFFRVCRMRGLTGRQGVVIPEANVRNLMLSDEVVRAVGAGTFSVWSVRSVDEATERLMGIPAGERDPDGTYPEGSLHRRVEQRLERFAEQARRLGLSDAAGFGTPTGTPGEAPTKSG